MENLGNALPGVPGGQVNDEDQATNLALDLFGDGALGPNVVRVLRENNASVSTLRRLLANPASFKKCMCCPRHCKDRSELLDHMREAKHFYGVANLNDLKSDFIKRLSDSHEQIPTNSEFRDIHQYFATLGDHEKAEYSELLFLTLLQIRFRRE